MSAIKEHFHNQIELDMKAGNLSNKGNIDDIRCSLNFGDFSFEVIKAEINYERQNKNRKTVIKLFESKLRKIQNQENKM